MNNEEKAGIQLFNNSARASITKVVKAPKTTKALAQDENKMADGSYSTSSYYFQTH